MSASRLSFTEVSACAAEEKKRGDFLRANGNCGNSNYALSSKCVRGVFLPSAIIV